MNGRHLATDQCTERQERNSRKLAKEELQEILERDFQASWEPLETVTSFKYLGRVLTVGEDDWMAVAGNLRKARKSWMQMTKILGQ